MPAFGLNRYTQAYAVAVRDAGTRIADKPVSCVDRLAADLFQWGGAVDLKITFRFIYPFVGGTAVSNSFNLANPAIGRITWEGGVTHNANGITGNGTDGLGRTNMTLAGSLLSDSFVDFGVYSRSAVSGNIYDLGSYLYAPYVGGLLIGCRWSDGNAYFYNGYSGPAYFAVSNSQGLFASLRNEAQYTYAYRNGGGQVNGVAYTNPAVSPPTPILLLANIQVSGTNLNPGYFSPRNLALAYLTNARNYPGINDRLFIGAPTQAELYTMVQSFQTRLGRQV